VEDPEEVINEAHKATAFEVLAEEIKLLPERERLAVCMLLEEHSVAQISMITGRPVTTVARQLQRAKLSLRSSGRLRRLIEHLSVFPAAVWHWSQRRPISASLVASAGMVGAIWIALPSEELGDKYHEGSRGPVPYVESGAQGVLTEVSARNTNADDRVEAAQPLDTAAPEGFSEALNHRASTGKVTEPATPLRPYSTPMLTGEPQSRFVIPNPDDYLVGDIGESRWENEAIKSRWSLVDGKKHGFQFDYRRDGSLRIVSEWRNGAAHGAQLFLDATGAEVESVVYWSDNRVTGSEKLK